MVIFGRVFWFICFVDAVFWRLYEAVADDIKYFLSIEIAFVYHAIDGYFWKSIKAYPNLLNPRCLKLFYMINSHWTIYLQFTLYSINTRINIVPVIHAILIKQVHVVQPFRYSILEKYIELVQLLLQNLLANTKLLVGIVECTECLRAMLPRPYQIAVVTAAACTVYRLVDQLKL